MGDKYPYRSGAGVQTGHLQQHHPTTTMSQPLAQRVVKTVGAATAGGSMMVLSGLTLVATVICITVITPLLVIFSPVLVPAAITLFLFALGFASSGGFGLAAVSVMSWLYRYMTGKHPVGADQIDYARSSLAAKARDIEETVGQKLEQAQS